MQAPGLKSDIMGIVGLHEMRVYGKENLKVLLSWQHELNNENILIIISGILLL